MSSSSKRGSTKAVVHVWPNSSPDSQLSSDPQCAATVLFVQLYMPGQFAIQHCTNPDLSPSGQLPYLTHGLHTVTGFHGIVKYISGVTHQDPNSPLTSTQRAQATARVAHLESNMGDLVAHVLYALSANWVNKTRPALVKVLPIPQRFYLPERIRLSYQPRLEAAELWNATGVEQEVEQDKERFSFRRPARKNRKAEEKAKYKETMQRNRILDKARSLLDMYNKLVGDSRFIFDVEQPSTLDISLAAHVYLLKQDQHDNLIKDLLLNEYPSLIAHADRVYQTAFPVSSASPAILPLKTGFSLRALLPSAPPTPTGPKPRALTEQERKFSLMRRAFFGGGFLIAAGYIFTQRHAFVQFYHLLQQLIVLAEAQARQGVDGGTSGADESNGETGGDVEEEESEGEDGNEGNEEDTRDDAAEE